jgi:hypothetical protein
LQRLEADSPITKLAPELHNVMWNYNFYAQQSEKLTNTTLSRIVKTEVSPTGNKQTRPVITVDSDNSEMMQFLFSKENGEWTEDWEWVRSYVQKYH